MLPAIRSLDERARTENMGPAIAVISPGVNLTTGAL